MTLTASTAAWNIDRLSTSATRSRTVLPAKGVRSKDIAVAASTGGSPGWVWNGVLPAAPRSAPSTSIDLG